MDARWLARLNWIVLLAAALLAVGAARLLRWAPASDAEPDPSLSETSASLPPVRVLLGSNAQDRWSVRVAGPYAARKPGEFYVLAQGAELPTAEVTANDEGLRIGERQFQTDRVLIELKDDGGLHVGDSRYRGDLLLVAEGGKISAINVVPIEDYLSSVVSGEMPSTFPDAALAAQAIAARTYAIYQMKTFGRTSDFDVYDSTRSQTYQGMEITKDGRRLAVESSASRHAVEATRGLVLTYDGELFCTFYSAVCGGHTIDSFSAMGRSWPALVGVPCDYCSDAENFTWHREFAWSETLQQLQSQLTATGRSVGNVQTLAAEKIDDGVLPTFRIEGTDGELKLSSIELRRLVFHSQLPSMIYDVKREDDRLSITGHGWGHGVGLCQWGAKRQAELGHDTLDILDYYYPGSKVARIR